MKRSKSKAPAVDIRKVIRAAAEAALEEPSTPQPQAKKRRLSGGRAVLIGAGAVTAGRLLVRGRGGGLVNSLQDRLSGLGVDLPGKPKVDPDLDEDLVDEPEEVIDDLVDEEPEATEDEEPDEDEEPSDGGAPERRVRGKRRGR
jgi:hypothetical protein